MDKLPNEILERIFEYNIKNFLVIMKIGQVCKRYKDIMKGILERKNIGMTLKIESGKSPSFVFGDVIEIYNQNDLKKRRTVLEIQKKKGLILPWTHEDEREVTNSIKFYKRDWELLVKDYMTKYYRYRK